MVVIFITVVKAVLGFLKGWDSAMVAMKSINQKLPVWWCGVVWVVVLLPIIIPP